MILNLVRVGRGCVTRFTVRQDVGVAEPNGYDPGFLAIEVPLPSDKVGRDIRILTYPHFSVALDTDRRLAAVTAVNIDGAGLRDLPRTGEWYLDDRVPADQQAGPAVYANNDLDRGHLVRRRDPGWGPASTATAATEATFAYPNAAPQMNVFNQSKDLWLGLEDHVLRYADANDHRVSVFTAPVLDDAEDPPYRGILVPLRFWKVAAWADGKGRLAAAGFVLDQSDLLRLEDGQRVIEPLGSYRTFQVPIAEIETLAGIDLRPLVAADVLVTETAKGPADWRTPLRTFEDIQFG